LAVHEQAGRGDAVGGLHAGAAAGHSAQASPGRTGFHLPYGGYRGGADQSRGRARNPPLSRRNAAFRPIRSSPSNDPRRTSMTRLRLALAALAAAAATAAVLAASGSAQTAPIALHLVSKSQKGVGFFPKGRPHQGDAVGFGDKISGDETGFDRAACTV